MTPSFLVLYWRVEMTSLSRPRIGASIRSIASCVWAITYFVRSRTWSLVSRALRILIPPMPTMSCWFEAPRAWRIVVTAAVMFVTGVPFATLSQAVETVPEAQPDELVKKSAANEMSFWRLSWSTSVIEAVISMSIAASLLARISSAIRYSSANWSALYESLDRPMPMRAKSDDGARFFACTRHMSPFDHTKNLLDCFSTTTRGKMRSLTAGAS